MTKSIIVAMGKEREIGVGPSLPWRIPEDMRRFKELTTGHTIIMGRKTYESIGKPLPNRTNIIVTKNQNYEAPGCIVVHSLDEALEKTDPGEEVFVIGGATIYKQTLPVADKMYVTEVDEIYPDADVFFPEFDLNEWQLVQETGTTAPETASPSYHFLVYERIIQS